MTFRIEKDTMGEVGEAHQAHGHRQPYGDHVQDHPVGKAMEGHAHERREQTLHASSLGRLGVSAPGRGSRALP